MAAAKYLGLTSSKTGADYSDYSYPTVEVPDKRVAPDKTAPEVCQIEVTQINKETGEVTVSIEASDQDSYILYCSYSLDGGKTYSELLEWPRPTWNTSEKEHSITVTVPFEQETELRVKAYNGFDVFKESKSVFVAAIRDPEVKKAREEEALQQYKNRAYEEISLLENEETLRAPIWPVVISIGIIIFLMFFIVLFLTRNIFRLIEHSNRR